MKQENTVVHFPGSEATIGGTELAVIAGPCAVESREQIFAVAERVHRAGAQFFRGGAYKPRTSPYAFQGLGEEGLRILAEVRERLGLLIVTEAIDQESLDLVEEYADVIQIGARNMQNFSLLKRAGRSRKPVLLKRGMSATLEEFLMAAEYVMSEGNYNVVLCERGVRTFADHTRNTLDLSVIPAVQRLSHLPILVDPSHGTGKRDKVIPLSRAAVAVGADGLIVEVHHDPDHALSDGMQSLYPDQFDELMAEVRQIASRRTSRLPTPDAQKRPARGPGCAGCRRCTIDVDPPAKQIAAGLVGLSACWRWAVAASQPVSICASMPTSATAAATASASSTSTASAPSLPLPSAAIPRASPPVPTRNEVYAVNSGSDNVSVIDAERNQVVATIGVHHTPFFIDVSADGTRGYVANSGSANVSVLDLQTRRVLATVGVGGAPGVARVSPDGTTVVVSNRGGDSVSLIDTQSNRLRSTITVCRAPPGTWPSSDSSKAFVACTGSDQVAAVDLRSAALLALLNVGRTPVSLAVKPDGGEIFVCNFDSDSISVIETSTNEVGNTFLIGTRPSHALVSSDNSLLYVSNFGADAVAVYGIDTGKLAYHGAGGQPSRRAGAQPQSALLAGQRHAGR